MRERLTRSLLPRLVLMLTLVLAVAGGVQYVLVARGLERDLVVAQAEDHAADAASVQRVAATAGDGEDPLVEATAVLRAVAARPFVEEAVIADARGTVVAAADEDDVGRSEPEPQILAAARSGRSFSAVPSADEGRRGTDLHFSYIAPVRIAGARYAFEVEQERAQSAQAIGGARLGIVGALGGSLVLAILGFLLLGGRRIDREYRAALDRAERDGMTDLPNHRAFQRDLELACRQASAGRPVGLALLDVDDFKLVNDEHGHRRGDDVLLTLASVARGATAGVRAYRLGGDEFALLVTDGDGARTRGEADGLLARARAELAGTTVSVGLATARSPDPDGLWAAADRALYETKRGGGDGASWDPGLGDPEDQGRTTSKARAIRAILDDAAIDVAFQPIWDLDRDRPIGYEALARPRDLHGLSSVGEAFDVAERVGRAVALDRLCRSATLARAHRLPHDVRLFLNVSPQSLGHESLASEPLVKEMRDAGLTPARVVLEITERSEARLAAVHVQRLRALGFRIALDDVGAGNAGLRMLHSIDVDYVKVDRSVVQAVADEPRSRAILQAVLAFAGAVGAYVIVEGIEHAGHLTPVPRTDDPRPELPPVRGAQGFGLGRPRTEPETGTPPSALGAAAARVAGGRVGADHEPRRAPAVAADDEPRLTSRVRARTAPVPEHDGPVAGRA